MELKINEVQLPMPITFNYEELKNELAKKVSMYEAIVYSDEQIKSAKEDRASLNRLKKALNDERIRREKEYMQPFNDFKSKINEIIGIIDKPVAIIDAQVKEYEEKLKNEKKVAIEELFNSMGFQLFVKLDMIFDPKWLNASVSLKKIEEQLKSELYRIGNDIDTLHNLSEFSFEATEVYKSTLDISKAIAEGRRLSDIAKAKAAHEAEMKARAEEQARFAEEASKARIVKPEEVPQPAHDGFINPPIEETPAKQWVSFKCLLSVEDAQALGQFFTNRNIAYEQI